MKLSKQNKTQQSNRWGGLVLGAAGRIEDSLSSGTPPRPICACAMTFEEMMKKRLRKKKHRGEFAEFGRQLLIRKNAPQDQDAFISWFIQDVIEDNGCACGGSILPESVDVIVELGRRSENPEEKKNSILRSLNEHPDIVSVQFGEEFDLWYQLPKDLDEEVSNQSSHTTPASAPR